MDTFYRFLAVLGACSWLIPLVVLIRSLVLKPNLSIYSHEELEIGYSTFGPIMNINLAFSAEKKQALINRIDLELTHQNNETHKFTWQWFEEKLSEVESQEGLPFLYKKNQKAIAIKVLLETLIEKKNRISRNRI